MELIKKTNFDFLGNRKYFYIISLTIIIAGIISFSLRGKKNFGTDFIGGDMLQIQTAIPASSVFIRNSLSDLHMSQIRVQTVGSQNNQFIIKSLPNTSSIILAKLQDTIGQSNIKVLSNSVISPTMSTTLRNKALIAFIIGLVAILIYIAIRFEFHFGVTATIATFHDLLIVMAFMALAGKTFDSTLIAALLTIAGYSTNDTIVIFDRIRENIRKTRSTNYIEVFNKSINETLSRTTLTVCTVVFVDLALFFFGGQALHDFAYALLIGFIVGAYSSIFIASAIIISWQKKDPFKIKL
ncbi:MAG: protein translocase subunit SecF [Candidatus Omnitrophica bacterium]|nr:protein translocase subunit SecF [Candidatus Omnitrophota bacterium]